MTLDTADLFTATTAANVGAPAPRKCARHRWSLLSPVVCVRCGKYRDEARRRTNANNRNRGKGTSRDLAAYLGPQWQNVEAMGWPWDVQCHTARLQSKRDQEGQGPARSRRIIEAITPGQYLRGLYWVKPGTRLTSGTVTVLLEEWVSWYGWAVPDAAVAIQPAGNAWLLRIPLPVFAAYVAGTTGG